MIFLIFTFNFLGVNYVSWWYPEQLEQHMNTYQCTSTINCSDDMQYSYSQSMYNTEKPFDMYMYNSHSPAASQYNNWCQQPSPYSQSSEDEYQNFYRQSPEPSYNSCSPSPSPSDSTCSTTYHQTNSTMASTSFFTKCMERKNAKNGTKRRRSKYITAAT